MHAAVQEIPQQTSKLERAGLAEATMLCNAVFRCGPAVHCLQQVPAVHAGMQETAAKHGITELVLL